MRISPSALPGFPLYLMWEMDKALDKPPTKAELTTRDYEGPRITADLGVGDLMTVPVPALSTLDRIRFQLTRECRRKNWRYVFVVQGCKVGKKRCYTIKRIV